MLRANCGGASNALGPSALGAVKWPRGASVTGEVIRDLAAVPGEEVGWLVG